MAKMVDEASKTWLPTAKNINNLPSPLRKYIHELESNADPAGMVIENALLRDQARQLDAMIGRLLREGSSIAQVLQTTREGDTYVLPVKNVTRHTDGIYLTVGER